MRLYFRYQYYICTCTVFTLIIRDAKNNNYFLNHELFKFGPAKNGVRELMESRIIVYATANRSSELPGSLSCQFFTYHWSPGWFVHVETSNGTLQHVLSCKVIPRAF